MTKTEARDIVADKLKYTRGVTNVTKDTNGILIQISSKFTINPATDKQINYLRRLCFWKFYSNLYLLDKATAGKLISVALEMKEFSLDIEVY